MTQKSTPPSFTYDLESSRFPILNTISSRSSYKARILSEGEGKKEGERKREKERKKESKEHNRQAVRLNSSNRTAESRELGRRMF